jgi:hypothetical protein
MTVGKASMGVIAVGFMDVVEQQDEGTTLASAP